MTGVQTCALPILGECYDEGLGVEQDDELAMEYWRRAAAHQQECNPKKCCALKAIGNCYANGSHGLDEDKSEASKFYTQAADLGCPSAQVALGEMHVRGGSEAVEKDVPLGVKYLRAAAANEEDPSQRAQDILCRLVRKENACMACGKSNAPKTCSGCKEARYCNSDCARAHWEHPKASHKPECKAARASRG